MKKILIAFLCTYLAVSLLLTCIFGYRSIGAQIVSYLSKADTYSGTDKVDKLYSAVEEGFKNGFFADDRYIDLYGYIQKKTGKTIIPGSGDTTVVRSDNGVLYFGNTDSVIDRSVDEKHVELSKKNVSAFYDFCNAENVTFLFAMAPNKATYVDESVLPDIAGLRDYAATADAVCDAISENGVPVLNLGKMLREKYPGDFSQVFFKTDHHWTISSAFFAFQMIGGAANELGAGFDEEYLKTDSYSVNVIEDCLLGSIGARVGSTYVGKDDFELIVPEFYTKFSVNYNNTYGLGITESREGPFDKSILNINDNTPDYSSYIASDRSLIHVDNNLIDNGKNVLLIKDSFGIPVSGWLSCCADELWIADLRYKQETSMYDFVKEHDIDVVIILYNSSGKDTLECQYTFDTVSPGK